ncbi:MAG: hypothetical protein Tsb0034_01860 [Ekhidna sp.]
MKVAKGILLILILVGCGAKPKPINYGSDACVFCKMTIVDRQHAAEIVTVKGKAFKYDAIECMMNDLAKWEGPEVAFYLTNDYTNPGDLIDATSAHYLISEDIPSPMGEFLTAFSDPGERAVYEKEITSSLNWSELKKEFGVNR